LQADPSFDASGRITWCRLGVAARDGRELETLDRARELADRRCELRSRWERLGGLVRKLRARRDRLAG
jgi:hypothetical protein